MNKFITIVFVLFLVSCNKNVVCPFEDENFLDKTDLTGMFAIDENGYYYHLDYIQVRESGNVKGYAKDNEKRHYNKDLPDNIIKKFDLKISIN